MILLGNRVPMFKLQPYRSLLLAAVFTLIVGGLISAYFFIEDIDITGSRWIFSLIVTLILTLLLVLSSFSRYGFRHLWHHRSGYKRG